MLGYAKKDGTAIWIYSKTRKRPYWMNSAMLKGDIPDKSFVDFCLLDNGNIDLNSINSEEPLSQLLDKDMNDPSAITEVHQYIDLLKMLHVEDYTAALSLSELANLYAITSSLEAKFPLAKKLVERFRRLKINDRKECLSQLDRLQKNLGRDILHFILYTDEWNKKVCHGECFFTCEELAEHSLDLYLDNPEICGIAHCKEEALYSSVCDRYNKNNSPENAAAVRKLLKEEKEKEIIPPADLAKLTPAVFVSQDFDLWECLPSLEQAADINTNMDESGKMKKRKIQYYVSRFPYSDINKNLLIQFGFIDLLSRDDRFPYIVEYMDPSHIGDFEDTIYFAYYLAKNNLDIHPFKNHFIEQGEITQVIYDMIAYHEKILASSPEDKTKLVWNLHSAISKRIYPTDETKDSALHNPVSLDPLLPKCTRSRCYGEPCEGRCAFKSKKYGNDNERIWCSLIRNICTIQEAHKYPDLRLPYNCWTLIELLKFDDLISYIPCEMRYKEDYVAHLSSSVNRANTIRERLFCRECKRFMQFTIRDWSDITREQRKISSRVYYNVIARCQNPECSQYNKPVLLNHCMGCDDLIDSRDCHFTETEDNYINRTGRLPYEGTRLFYLCLNCGSPQSPEDMICPKCGMALGNHRWDHHKVKCPNCGNEMIPPSQRKKSAN